MRTRLIITLIAFLSLICSQQAYAQRFLLGQRGIQITGGCVDGFNLQKKDGQAFFGGIALSTYTKNGNRWTFGAEYLQKSYEYKEKLIPLSQLTAEGGYYLKFLSDPSKTVSFSLGLSAMAGYETINWGKEILFDGAYTVYEENNKEYFSISEQLMSYDSLTQNIYTLFPDPLDFFDALEAASSMSVLDEIKMEISKIGDGNHYNFNALSEGEQQLISVLGLMAILKDDQDEVLYLIDEPDTHINPKWQRNFVKSLLDITGNNIQCRYVFISAHSPFLVQAYDNNVDILLFNKDESGSTKIDIADYVIKNWRIDQVLMSPYFDLTSSRPEQLDSFMERRLAIIRKGILTNVEREELKQLENELGFLPTGETILEIENMALINETAKRLKEE